MDDATGRPRRMRYSFETRCRAVTAMLTGLSPGTAALAVGAARATGYRWWAHYQADGFQARVHPQAAAAAPEPGRRGGDPGGPPAQRRRAARCWGAPPRPWGRCCGGGGARAVPRSPGRPSCAMNGPSPASCSRTPLARFWHVGKRIRQAASGAARAPASSIRHRRPLPAGLRRCGPRTGAATPSPFWIERWRGSALRDLRAGGDDG